ncbi:hypothetical protein QFZ67_005699 [Streptomyces sp. V1I1]|nr:hypothetical protein [Streptomyces sp. V1I1]
MRRRWRPCWRGRVWSRCCGGASSVISGELLWKWNDKFLLGDREETRSRIRELHRVFGAAG